MHLRTWFLLLSASLLTWPALIAQEASADIKQLQEQILQELRAEKLGQGNEELYPPAMSSSTPAVKLAKHWMADMNADGEADLIQTFYHETGSGKIKFFWLGLLKEGEVFASDRLYVGVVNYAGHRKNLFVDSISNGVMYTTYINPVKQQNYEFVLLENRLIKRDYIDSPAHIRVKDGIMLKPASQDYTMTHTFDWQVEEEKVVPEGALYARLEGNDYDDFIFAHRPSEEFAASVSTNIKPLCLASLELFQQHFKEAQQPQLSQIIVLLKSLPDSDFEFDGKLGHGLMLRREDAKDISIFYEVEPAKLLIRTR